MHDCKTGLVVAQWDENTNAEHGYDYIPSDWNIDRVRLVGKIEELLSDEWVARIKDGFTETFNTALEQ